MSRNTQPDASTALAKRRENGGIATNSLADQIRVMERQFQAAMPKGAEAQQLIRDALTCLRMTPGLATCSSPSVLGALMNCAQMGLRPGVLGHAYLIPFKGKAQLVIGYQGMVDLAFRSGRVLSISARTVYANDHFELEYRADGDHMIHRPALDGDRGEPRLYYARAQLTDGGYAMTDPMSHAEMQRYRDRNAMSKNGPWRDHFEGMAWKTMIRRLSKLLPKSVELAHAVAVDGGIRVDVRGEVDPAEATELPVMDGEVIDEAGGADPANDATLDGEEWPAVRTPAGGES
jgi:recombination protein RecT